MAARHDGSHLGHFTAASAFLLSSFELQPVPGGGDPSLRFLPQTHQDDPSWEQASAGNNSQSWFDAADGEKDNLERFGVFTLTRLRVLFVKGMWVVPRLVWMRLFTLVV